MFVPGGSPAKGGFNKERLPGYYSYNGLEVLGFITVIGLTR